MKALRFTLLVAIVTASTALVSQDNSKTVELYKAKCAKCHGADGTATAGGKKLGGKDAWDPEVMKMTDAQMIETTKSGKNKMPAYGKSLDDTQIKELVAYLRGLAKNHGSAK
jgi:mono/diheme cytochrome c family protein